MYGGDPGFAFEYGGSWADWHEKHRDTMPVEQYIQTKLPKERLPFREMEEGGIARVGFNKGKEGELFGIPWEDIRKFKEKERMDRTSPFAIPDDWLERLLRKFRKTETYEQPKTETYEQPKTETYEQPMASGGLAYMLGEPTYMKYSAGGSVGHAPWLKPTAQQQPQQQLDTPPPQVGGGRPNPMKAPRGLPSLAPRTMDPAYMQQQMMQKAMMGQQRPGMEEGGITPTIPEQFLEDFKRRKYEDILDEYHRWKEDYERRKDLAPTQEAAGGGRIGFGLGSMSRRAFLKMMAAIAALPLVGKGATKVAPKVIPKVTETVARGADGMPVYITDLIEVVKAKGTKDIIEGFKRSDYSTVHSYKGVEVVEDGAGNIKIKKPTEGVATDASTGKMHEGTSQEVHIEINKGGTGVKDEGLETQKTFQEPDEYIEGTVRPDMDGKMKDFEEFIDESDHLELKKIADEVDTLEIPGYDRFSKASGGLAYMLGE